MPCQLTLSGKFVKLRHVPTYLILADPDKPSGRIRGPLRVKNTMVPPPASPPHSPSIPIKSAGECYLY